MIHIFQVSLTLFSAFCNTFQVNKTIWHFNRSLWKAYNERKGVSVSHRPIPNNFKKMLCKNFQPGNPEACQNQDNCTFAHGQEELDKYRMNCRVRNLTLDGENWDIHSGS